MIPVARLGKPVRTWHGRSGEAGNGAAPGHLPLRHHQDTEITTETPRWTCQSTPEAQGDFTGVVDEIVFHLEKGVVSTAEWFKVDDDALGAEESGMQNRPGFPGKMVRLQDNRHLCVFLCVSAFFLRKTFLSLPRW